MLEAGKILITTQKEFTTMIGEAIEEAGKIYEAEIQKLEAKLKTNSNKYTELEFKYNALLQENDILKAKLKPKKGETDTFNKLASEILGEEHE